MLRGFALVTYWADDLEAAKEWYAELLGIEPRTSNARDTTSFVSATTSTSWD
jgi:hypothetical protein